MGVLTLHRAATPEERQGVVANVETCFRREGQGVGKHYFRWETDDGATPADVECIDDVRPAGLRFKMPYILKQRTVFGLSWRKWRYLVI